MQPQRLEIDHRTTKLVVGIVAFTLAPITFALSGWSITSISASFWEARENGTATVFIGFLFAVAAFLISYNGYNGREMILAKVAAVAAAGVALFPCGCEQTRGVPILHYGAAAIMFATLALFTLGFRRRAIEKGHREAMRRARIYLACGAAIVLAMLALALTNLVGERFRYYVLVWEWVALAAFGISWFVASRITPGLASDAERFNPLPGSTPPRA